VTGATVRVYPYIYDGPRGASPSGVTDGAGFYRIDFDAQTNTDPSNLMIAEVEAESPGHEKTGNYVSRSATGSETVSQNLHLYEIKRITADESTFLTVELNDTVLCFEGDFVCRTVHIVVPKDGRMSVEAVPTSSAANAGLEIDGQRGSCLPSGCSLTASMQVTAAQEVVAKIGIREGSTASQSFVLKTSLVRR
jgi:hypothetical protein